MQFIPIKTRILQPPQDDLFSLFSEALATLQEGDVLVISSKVVAIHEARCVLESEFDKEKHIEQAADVVIPRPNWPSPLTIINNVMVGAAGVDRSNSNDYFTLLPLDPFASAERVYKYIEEHFKLKHFGVIITDSRSQPCRYGATGVEIGFWGLKPLESHIGKEDLFGRKMRFERTNIVDAIAAGANLVMGEVAESTPLVIVRGVPNLQFELGNFKDQLFCPFEDDIMKVLYERFLKAR